MAWRRHNGSSCPGQRLVKICQKVIHVLDADRDAHQSVADTSVLACGRGHEAMRGAAGNADETFHATQAQGGHHDTQPTETRVHVAGIAQLEGQHSTKPAHLPRGDRMVGMFRQSRVIHTGHDGLGLQESGELCGVFIVAGYAQGERLKPRSSW